MATLSLKFHLGVSQLLQNLRPHKAAGPNNLPSYMYFLKEVANEIPPNTFCNFLSITEPRSYYMEICSDSPSA